MLRRLFLCLALLVTSTLPVQAQSLPFTVTMLEVQNAPMQELTDIFRVYSGEKELVWCVVAFTRKPVTNGVERIVIHDVVLARVGERNRIPDVANLCLNPDGTPQPMIHTHNDANCQASPWDIATIITRDAPFDGIQCGDKQVVWLFASQYQAVVRSTPVSY